eukprot:1160775-Pelagomonas_calceolata.AAC.3
MKRKRGEKGRARALWRCTDHDGTGKNVEMHCGEAQITNCGGALWRCTGHDGTDKTVEMHCGEAQVMTALTKGSGIAGSVPMCAPHASMDFPLAMPWSSFNCRHSKAAPQGLQFIIHYMDLHIDSPCNAALIMTTTNPEEMQCDVADG